MTVTWGKPVDENGFIRKYTLVFSYTLDQKKTSIENSTNGQTSSYSFSVLGGIQYDVELWAETIKPGPKATSSKQVPVYSKYGFNPCFHCISSNGGGSGSSSDNFISSNW